MDGARAQILTTVQSEQELPGIEMIVLRAYLLLGLLAHKVVWELLKRGGRVEPRPIQSVSLRLVKGVKVGLLLAILFQTVLPRDVLRISAEPFLLRVAGVVLYTVGLLTALAGRIQLGQSWSDIESPRADVDRAVVSEGLYRYIRHPIYTGDLLLLLGFELSLNSWLWLGVVALIPVVLFRSIREEKMLAQSLPGYGVYLARTKRFIPFVV